MSGGTNLVTITISAMGWYFSQRRQRKVISRGCGFFALAATLVDFPAIDSPLMKQTIRAAIRAPSAKG
jgi:hypothetical protein